MRKIRIGTRGSPLALVQANMTRDLLIGLGHKSVEIEIIKTSGDIFIDRNFSEIGTKGIFTKEIEDKLLDKSIDIAVHSMKDMASILPDGLIISAVLPREMPNDALISKKYNGLHDMKGKIVIGSSSLRRRIQLKNINPEFEIVNFRGNVNTRLNKINNGEADATILATAGLKRLSIDNSQYHIINEKDMLPAATQGIIAIQSRENDDYINEILSKISHDNSMHMAKAERGFLYQLEEEKRKKYGIASYNACQTPAAALSIINNSDINIRAMIGDEVDNKIFFGEISGNIKDAEKIGMEVAKEIFDKL